jgi:hypothetical protein
MWQLIIPIQTFAKTGRFENLEEGDRLPIVHLRPVTALLFEDCLRFRGAEVQCPVGGRRCSPRSDMPVV